MSKRVVSSKLFFKTKLGYGAAEWSSTLTWTMVSVLFLFYLTDIVGLNPAFAGFVLMVGAMWDAVSDPTVGIISDRFKSRWGRRRPFLLPMTRKRHAALKEAIQLKKEGRAWDTESIKEIL